MAQLRSKDWDFSELRIRPMRTEDIPALARLEEANFSMPWSEQAFEALLTHSYCHYFVAETDGCPVGFAGFVGLGDEGDIDKVMVDAEHRRKGIAYALLGRLIDEGRKEGISSFTLEVRAGNLPAIRLYEKLGFRSEGVRPGFYEKPAEDALIMWLREADAGK